jgi:UDP-glucose:(heptosyl)LPS alpha-1,3-glucosyltransferase
MRFPAGLPRALYRLTKQLSPRKNALLRAIEQKQYDPARKTRVVAVSRMVAEHLMRYEGVARERIRVIPNAIDAGRLRVEDPAGVRQRVRKHLGLGESDLLALFAGHNFWLKGLKPLLQALRLRSALKANARPIHLLVCGGGKLAPFRNVVKRLGLEDTVHLVGFLPEVADGFWASDFFVLPTYYDPCSLVVFEALACGLPVITTACNGAGELINEGREGFVIERPDALDALADRLEQMTDDAARRAMSANAVALGQAQSFDRHVTRLLELCEEVAYAKAIATPHVLSHARAARR